MRDYCTCLSSGVPRNSWTNFGVLYVNRLQTTFFCVYGTYSLTGFEPLILGKCIRNDTSVVSQIEFLKNVEYNHLVTLCLYIVMWKKKIQRVWISKTIVNYVMVSVIFKMKWFYWNVMTIHGHKSNNFKTININPKIFCNNL